MIQAQLPLSRMKKKHFINIRNFLILCINSCIKLYNHTGCKLSADFDLNLLNTKEITISNKLNIS